MVRLVPRPPPKDLPDDHNASTINLVHGLNEIYPSPLLFEQVTEIKRDIDHALRYRDSPYAVVMPVATSGNGSQTCSWGPPSAINSGNNSSFDLVFPQVECSATSPPVSMMEILTPGSSRNIRILQNPSVNFVTRADVQKEVVKWMKELADHEQTNRSGASLSRVNRVPLPDGTQVDVELWQWKGLKRHSLESDVWEMCL